MKEDCILVTTACNSCGSLFKSKVSKRYIAANGRVTHGVYCNYCRRIRDGIRRGRTSEYLDRVHSDVMLNNSAVKVYSAKEIAEFERGLHGKSTPA